MTEINKI